MNARIDTTTVRNQTYLLIRTAQMRKPHYTCRDFAECLDAPQFIPAGAGHLLVSREVTA